MKTEDAPLLQMRGMHKSFPNVRAVADVDLALRAGEVRALLGENGAGKSTLVKMIYGILRADAGEIFWRGRRTFIANPAQAKRLGVAMVFQHFSLFDSLTVLENIALGMDAKPKVLKHGRDTPKKMNNLRDDIHQVSARYGLPLAPDRHVYTLSVGERQRIEIIRCLLQQPKLLVMDEPTSVLTPQEVEKLFATLSRLADEGMAILYISHKLEEIKRLCKTATVLRAGKVVADVEVAKETTATLAAKMMGADWDAKESARARRSFGETRLRVQNLNSPADAKNNSYGGVALKNISLTVRGGEILGIAGVAGNGQDELLKALSGETPSDENNAVQIDGAGVAKSAPNARRMLGLATVPEERLGHGAVPSMSLVQNSLLTAYRRLNLVSHGFIFAAASARWAQTIIDKFQVKTGGVLEPATSLSGGNLQKFIVGREICQAPELLIVSQPTWGVDAGAARAIRHALRARASDGAAVLVISQDLDELLEISDSIAAICAGRLSASLPVGEVNAEQIGLLMAGADADACAH